MIRFHLKIQNNMVTVNLLSIVASFVLGFNFLMRIFPKKFINISGLNDGSIFSRNLIPKSIYYYCDVYLLLLFIILIFFLLGTDFNNSMEEIALAIGGSRTNKFMIRKLGTILLLYCALYMVTWVNTYTLYLKMISGHGSLIPIKEIIFYSLTTNVFIISLSLYILFLFRDIAVSTAIITSYYLIEEALWRCKITQTNGILGHIYQYFDYEQGGLFNVKAVYIILSVALLFMTYKLSKRKNHSLMKLKDLRKTINKL